MRPVLHLTAPDGASLCVCACAAVSQHHVRSSILQAERDMPPAGGRGNRTAREPPVNEPQVGVEACLRSVRSRLLGPPFLVDAFKMAPLPNADMASLPPLHERLTEYPYPRRWGAAARKVRGLALVHAVSG